MRKQVDVADANASIHVNVLYQKIRSVDAIGASEVLLFEPVTDSSCQNLGILEDTCIASIGRVCIIHILYSNLRDGNLDELLPGNYSRASNRFCLYGVVQLRQYPCFELVQV